MRRSRPSCCLSLVTSATTSPRTMVVLFHSAFSSVDENTYFGMALILSAHGSVRLGQSAAKPSYVVLPINIASHASAWPNPSRIYASSRYSKNPEMSAPAKTPSTETRVYSIIFRIRWCPFTKMCRDHVARADSGTWVDLAVALVLKSGVCVNGVSICTFPSNACSWEMFPFHLHLREVSITFHI